MRRKDREQSEEFGWDVLKTCPFAVLSMIGEDGGPYAIPVSPAVHDGAIYFHSAKHGEKSKLLRANPAVCLTAVRDVVPLPEEYATEYASAAVRGTVAEVTDEAEQIAGLRAIVEHYAPSNLDYFSTAIAEELKRTLVWKIVPEKLTAKARLHA
ncbi:pyridoxamine 5'-phosphate oxidase family protein [Adlercreutzia sp. R25]|uniref:Pyridoxamine 5'-phosphate oxidase family protein n=1 Tax=Adlercreutzia shanghongiae TaxID=3111773 RepID=A0ABU6IVD9_9ACTN|nr:MULTISPECIES: pyridoxamine 5'-phosphate oxidase family protein [unclassified Adlercreutzia]MEC4272022.1 pyridoxamine 5'-phosphate oxidase family protein [Adlercreutzia sp. R25]MEC4293753.1 pyridoxamine 5'-phosphate oxidase family protein [Adlercreutzia sp. R22]